MPLYGNELGPDVTPFEANLGRVVKFGKPGPFVGREALAERAAAGPRQVLTGLVVRSSKRVPRHGYTVLRDSRPAGLITSGAPSPTLGMPIAMAYLDPSGAAADVEIEIRGSAVPAEITDLPFYRRRH
jgi:aminomethyltransferase